MGPEYTQLQSLVKSEGLHTVCQEAGCPNIFECWEDREATFLIGGDQCTRRCDFCQIDTGKPQPLDRDEPRRVAESVQKMELRYATITGVARDDLDGRRRLAVRRDRARDPRAQPRHRRREPDPRLQRQARPAARGLRVPARGARPQRRDRAADLQADPAGVPLRPLARRDHPGPRLRPGHQVQPDPRHGRDPRGGLARRCATCTTPAASWSRSPSTSAPPRGTTPSSGGSSPRSSSSSRTRPTRSASPACCPDRWCARRTAPDACTVRPWTPARAPRSDPRPAHAHEEGSAAAWPRNLRPEKTSRRQQFVQTYRMAKKSDPAIGLWILGAFLLGAAVGFVAFMLLPGDGVLGLGHRGRRRPPARPAARADRLRPPRPEGGVRPDGGPARRRRRRAADAAPRLEDRPRDRVHQAAGRRPPRGRPARHRAGRRGQPAPAAAADGHRAPQARAGRGRDRRSTRSSAATARARCRCPSWSQPRHQARPQGQAGRDDRHPQPAQGARRQPGRTSRCPRARCRPA